MNLSFLKSEPINLIEMIQGAGYWSQFVTSLINNMYNSRVKPLEAEKKQMEQTRADLQTLQSKFMAVDTALQALRPINGGFIQKKAESSNTHVLTASATSQADNATLNIVVTSLAKVGTLTTNLNATSIDSPLLPTLDMSEPAANRTISLTVGTGSNATTVNIELTDTMTLAQLRDAINNAVPASVGKAVIINKGTTNSPVYELTFTTAETGVEKGSLSLTTSSSLTEIQNLVSNVNIDNATDAQFTVNGVSVTKSSNTVSDLFPGVTLNLKQLGSSTVTISTDTDKTVENVKKFVSAYNDLVKFFRDKNEVDTNNKNQSGSLRFTRADESALNQYRAMIGEVSVQQGGDTFKLSYFGITTDPKTGELKLDENTLKTRLQDAPDLTKQFFQKLGDEVGGPNKGLAIFGFTSPLQTSINNLNDLVKKQSDRINSELDKLQKEESLLRQKFSSLERVQANLDRVSRALQQLNVGLF